MRVDLLPSDAAERDDAMAPVAWYEGLQLLPQHFQAGDARLDSLLYRQMRAASPFCWGIDRIEWDQAALAAGRLRILLAAGQFPDGLAFSWSARQGGSLEQPLPMEIGDRPVRYALAAPAEDFNENGVGIGRYREHAGAPLADVGNRDEKAVITRRLPNLGIRPWDPLNVHYVQVPFVEIVNTASGFQATGFHPPAVRLLPGSPCGKEIAAMLQLLRAKARQLGVAPVTAPLTVDFQCGLGWVLSSLAAGLPRLEAQLASGAAHPYELLLSLAGIAGMVAPLAGTLPDCFPAYDHADPAAALIAVVHFVTGIANGIGVDRRVWQDIPFTPEGAGWVCTLPAGAPQPELLVRMTFGAVQSDAALASWLEHTLICLDADESRCREARIKGLARRQLASSPEPSLTAQPGQRYVGIHAGAGFDHAGRRLLIGAPDARAGVALSGVSLLVNG